MKANEFFKAMGINAVKQFLENGNIRTKEMHDDLKRLVESHELIGGDLEYAKKFYADCAFKRDKHLVRYKQAIADVESCMEVSSESN